MKSFRTYLQEGIARRDQSLQNLHTLNTAGNRKLVFAGSEMVGHIDFHAATPNVLPNSRDQHIAYINGSYRDSRLKIHRPVFRSIGSFSSHTAALEGIKAALQNLRK